MRFTRLLVCCLCGTALALDAAAANSSASTNNPYQEIVERNVFGLHDPLPPLITHIEQPRPRIYLTGISTMLPEKTAILKVIYPPSLGHPPREESLLLSEGQRMEDIQVIKVDPVARKVTITEAGNQTELTFDQNGLPQHPEVNGRSVAPAQRPSFGAFRPLPTRAPRAPESASLSAAHWGQFTPAADGATFSSGQGFGQR